MRDAGDRWQGNTSNEDREEQAMAACPAENRANNKVVSATMETLDYIHISGIS